MHSKPGFGLFVRYIADILRYLSPNSKIYIYTTEPGEMDEDIPDFSLPTQTSISFVYHIEYLYYLGTMLLTLFWSIKEIPSLSKSTIGVMIISQGLTRTYDY